ncbi:serine/threonine-protein kinase [Frankia sp. QA3]|uniref:serine/threonine-protein kinase n=1 Tax=Frankia sp. QA3 TaxID=710111 RepID=UPI000269C52C|nr:serine/threonine-protein kinase [Frankia sp. QA3]EIV95029.1 serine/threonine protein kinase [Frankia sp. QA3]
MLIDRSLVEAALPGYTVEGDLGRGGYGLVLAGQHRLIGRKVAIKILLDTSDDPDLRARFLAEARVLAELDHPHIVRIHDYVEHEGTCLLVMELLSGGTLKQRISTGPVSPETTCSIGLAAAAALANAHTQGVLHRDVKPDNIMFAGDGLLKVTDFGIAKIFDGAETTASAILGTPRYMAPEQIMGVRLFPSTDLYALAGVLYEMIAGRPLFGRQMAVQPLTHHHLTVMPEPLTTVPPPVSMVIMRALAKDPNTRFADATDFALELARAGSRAFGPNWLSRSEIKVRVDDEIREAALGVSSTPRPPTSGVPGYPGGPARGSGPRPGYPAGPGAFGNPAGVGGPARPGGPSGPGGPGGPVGRGGPGPGGPGPAGAGMGGYPPPPGGYQGRPGTPPSGPGGPGGPGSPGFTGAPTVRGGQAPGSGGWGGYPPGNTPPPYTPPPRPLGGGYAGAPGAGGPGGAQFGPRAGGPGGVPLGPTRQAVGARNRTPWIIGGVAFVLVVALTVGIVLAVASSDDGGDRGRSAAARIGTAYRGPALSVQGLSPYSLELDLDGSLLVSSLATDRIQKITPAGAANDFAGTGAGGSGGDGGPAIAAQLNGPGSTTRDKAGNIYIGDAQNNRIRKISPAGVISTIAGTGTAGYSGDGGPATAAQLNNAEQVTTGPDGSVYFSDYENHRIRKIDPAGIITTYVGTGVAGYTGAGGPATQARIDGPHEITMTDDGTLYFADLRSETIQKVTPDGIISSVAGTGEAGYAGDGGPARSAKLNGPSLSIGPDGRTLYLADYHNNRIRKIDPSGIITTVAGIGTAGSGGDGGPATAAQLKNPTSVVVDGAGALYIADNGNARVRRIDPNGTITTIARPG